MDAVAARRTPLAPVVIALAIVTIAAVGGLATDTTSAWYSALDRPSFQPPGAVFGPVWTVLYLALGISTWIAWRDVAGPRRPVIVGLFVANYALNLAWTMIFFQLHAPVAAGIEILSLLGTIVALIALLRGRHPAAAWLLAPYALWVGFATVLTWTIAATN
ncbi:MAG: tryptophan-rich sensory protein [Solirubrobacteraceae bacterium]|nr:tryptophan-rich sensory protein [Solirubrobacteraceae bacterium]